MRKFLAKLLCVILVCLLGGPVQRVPAHGSGTVPAGFDKISGAQKAFAKITKEAAPGTYVNFETPHVHPIDINPSGTKLAAVNTAGALVEIYDISGTDGSLTHASAVPVGFDPVTARWRTDTELWVVNQVSDSISIIDVSTGLVTNTIVTYQLADGDSDGDLEGFPNGDEPADVVFGTRGTTPVAVVSCSRTDVLQVYTLSPLALTDEIRLDGEDPRALAINTSGTDQVYAAIFESGNSSTLISGAIATSTSYPPNTAARNENNHADHPYFVDGAAHGMPGVFAINPPPNDGSMGAATVMGSYVSGGKSVSVLGLFAAGISPPNVPIIVRKDFADGDKWKDDLGADWTTYVTGARAAESGRFAGWDLLDNDIAIQPLDAGLTAPTYATRQMNICMALDINPAGANAGRVYLVGTDATNEVRFEPNITGTFTRVMLSITEANGTPVALVDLNEEHLDAAQSGVGTAYEDGHVTQAERDKSIGDPRGVAFSNDGSTVYISGMGSNNVIAANSTTGARVSVGHTIEVGAGPTGLAHHPAMARLYVMNKFDGSVSVIDTTTAGLESVLATEVFYDPTPAFVNAGRVHFYGTHENSGLGQIACASCHIDGRMDRLAWDLGDPGAILDGVGAIPTPADANFPKIHGYLDGLITGTTGTNPAGVHNTMVFPGSTDEADFGDFHPMKGPMTTQTLQDIIGKEPHHWRGDRDGIEEFAGAFEGLQGDDAPLNATAMLEFRNFLDTIDFAPNPFRLLDNTIPGGPDWKGVGTNKTLDMTGFYSAPAPATPKSFSATGTPMETVVPGGGNAWTGFNDYVDGTFDNPFRCVDCHTLPIGAGSTHFMNKFSLPLDSNFTEVPLSTLGNVHQVIVSNDGTGQTHIKVPQLRNQLDKEGFFLDQGLVSRAGFGLVHDGAVDGLARFLSEPAFQLDTDQRLADMMAFNLAIAGADFPLLLSLAGAPTSAIPPAAEDSTAHAAVGQQITINSPTPGATALASINLLIALADEGKIDLIVKGLDAGDPRGWYRLDDGGAKMPNTFQSDVNGVTNTLAELLTLAGGGAEFTFSAVPEGTGMRLGVHRDSDAFFDYTEILQGSDPADPLDFTAKGSLPSASWFVLLLLGLLLAAVGALRLRRRMPVSP
jgi:YVTN family beta-propeller protein